MQFQNSEKKENVLFKQMHFEPLRSGHTCTRDYASSDFQSFIFIYLFFTIYKCVSPVLSEIYPKQIRSAI